MHKVLISLALAFPTIMMAQAVQQSGATVYIDPMGGYETYLAAAIAKKHVPLIVVADRHKATYIITSTVAHEDLSDDQPAVEVNNSNTVATNGNMNGDSPAARVQASMQQGYASGAEGRALGETSASIAVIDTRSSRIVFAYAAGRMGTNQIQKTADDCAKHLRPFIEKPKR